MENSFRKSADLLDRYLTEVIAEEGVTPAQTAVVGFSQGTMMTLHVVPRRSEPVAAIVGFSGRLHANDHLKEEAVSKPPVLLVHGDMDEMIPVEALAEARNGLAEAGFQVQWHISRGIGHGIAPDGLGLALGFLKDRLGIGRG